MKINQNLEGAPLFTGNEGKIDSSTITEMDLLGDKCYKTLQSMWGGEGRAEEGRFGTERLVLHRITSF